MKTTLIAPVVTGILALSGLTSVAHAGSASPASSGGTTTEVRYVANTNHKGGGPVTKIIITRDANGRIISVKRG